VRRDPVIVLKLGGSVLSGEESLPRAVHEIYRWRRSGFAVVAVVSALAGDTEALLARAARDGEPGSPHATAALAKLGELRSAALLGVQLEQAGVPARVLMPAALRLRARGDPLDAHPVSLDATPLRRAFAAGDVAVVPGFFAHDAEGRAVLLGRGGSDLTALFLSARLRARCRLLKDVDGLYTGDPNAPGPAPIRYAEASWDDALATDGTIIQSKAVQLARAADWPFELARPGAERATLIGAPHARLDAPAAPSRPLRVALLGLGTVGGGVLAALRCLPECFQVVAACVRDIGRARPDVPEGLSLSTDPLATAASGADVVVEALGGVEPARTAIAVALRAGAHVVTANKAALAAHGAELEALAAASGRALLASAAAGGSVPLLPALRRLARGADCVRLDAVLNGTTTFVFEALARGSSLDEALALARRRGLCERDVQRDLSGRDAADKLVLAAHAATGCWLDARAIRCTPIRPADLARAQGGAVMRQVATLRRQGGALVGRVRPMALAPGHPLARARGAGNSAVLFTAGGRTRLHGTGAGRWPTAEAVIGDLFELVRERERMALADVA